MLKHLIIVLTFLAVHSCADKKASKREKGDGETSKQIKESTESKLTSLHFKHSENEYIVGDLVHFELSFPDTVTIDSVKTYANAQIQKTIKASFSNIQISTTHLPVGNNTFKIDAYLGNGKKESHFQSVKFLSDIQPKQLTVEIEKTYPHDPNAYTQGLFYDEGYMFESTGKRGKSSLRKVELETGELISSLSLPDEFFAEGIAQFNGKIIQLTWTSKTGFVYDKETLKLINKVKYSSQGWGLTSDGKKLIMSDGTSTIYFLDPEYFNELERIQVYDSKGPIKNLNELEYINNKVYANIWQDSYIISFDPETGKVLENIDCTKLVPEKYKNDHDNVLNGIAYDETNQRLFLTGKRWNKIYQVKIVEK